MDDVVYSVRRVLQGEYALNGPAIVGQFVDGERKHPRIYSEKSRR